MKRRWIMWTAAALIGLLAGAFFALDVPSWKRLDMTRLTELPQTTLIYDDQSQPLQSLYASENRRKVTPQALPEQLCQAFVAIEDARFYQHHGVDVYRIFGALLNNLKARRITQGASTITQQLIKLTHLSAEKTLSRKAQEAWLALELERKLSKEEILAAYLNVVYFGNGAYGIASAAQSYFGKELSQLTLAESALLAGIVKSPSSYAPHIAPEKAVARRNLVLSAMAEQGFVSREAADLAKNEPLTLHLSTDRSENTWYGDYILSQAATLLNISADVVYTGGYHVYSTISARSQQAIDELYAQNELFPARAADGTACESAFICLEKGSGAIKCMEGGRQYSVQRGLNRAVQMRRQPGSTLKPVSVYAAAIDLYDYTPVSLLQDRAREFDEGYTPSNASGTEHGTVTLRQALSRSMNLATLDLMSRISVDSALLYAQRLGLPLSEADRNISLALGCLNEGVTPLELCAAYTVLTDVGRFYTPYVIERICDAQGKLLYSHQSAPRQVLRDTTAAQLLSVLETAASSGTAQALSASGMEVAGKTGTVSYAKGGNQDIWTVALTPSQTCVVWMGFDQTDSAHVLPEGTVGGGYPARLAAAYLEKTGVCSEGFAWPDSVKEVVIDAAPLSLEGKVLLASPETPPDQRLYERLPLSKIPTSVSDAWEYPRTPETFAVGEQPDGSATFSIISLDALVEYRLMRQRTGDSAAEQIAALRGQQGAYLTWREEDGGRSLYWIEPYHVLRGEHGLEAAAPATQAIEWGGVSGKPRQTHDLQTPLPDSEASLFANMENKNSSP